MNKYFKIKYLVHFVSVMFADKFPSIIKLNLKPHSVSSQWQSAEKNWTFYFLYIKLSLVLNHYFIILPYRFFIFNFLNRCHLPNKIDARKFMRKAYGSINYGVILSVNISSVFFIFWHDTPFWLHIYK
jgi:hypothetical protein